jgi:hypothetical protein
MQALVGQEVPFDHGRQQMKLLANLEVTAQAVERTAEAIGRDIAGGQPAHTREAKLGCVFTQTTWDEEGYPIRDPDSTTYTGAIETVEDFGPRLYLEAWNRGWSRAARKVVSVAVKKGTILAAMAVTGLQPFNWSLSLLIGRLVQNGPESSRARRCWARRSEPLTARTDLRS